MASAWPAIKRSWEAQWKGLPDFDKDYVIGCWERGLPPDVAKPQIKIPLWVTKHGWGQLELISIKVENWGEYDG